MITQTLRATPVAGLVAPKLQTAYRRFLDALDGFAEAKIQDNAVPEWKVRRAQREIKRYRRLMHPESQLRALTMLTQFQRRDERPDEGCANVETIELSSEGRSPNKGATLTRSDIETTSVEDNRSIASHALDLSASRAYDCALDILGAYKLTGNFHINLEIVLKDINALDKVTFEVEPTSLLTYSRDCRHVLFRPNESVHMGQFSEIVRSIKGRVGFDGTRPWCTSVFH